MLSFTKTKTSKIIAKREGKDKFIYIDEDDSKPSLIQSSPQVKQNQFHSFLLLDKKINITDTKLLENAFKNDVHAEALPKQLQRKYQDAIDHVNACEKKTLNFGKEDVIPIIQEESYRIFISGSTGSGKSYFVGMFLKNNPIKANAVVATAGAPTAGKIPERSFK